ncbi:hypothetical protein LFL96_22720 [Paraburkholderia sp. D15]|uniref:hypothetical protein n=1 Tax=Paraburkholderia sp. D15 TaxID=2880218 RepID=UPI002479CC2F|nr:hypothetical protein [Paraburkholderia sp. D15]WGS53857.1 hypothetical protein LFL96_22720 [Paraburkholderia sp. D15]WKF60611.1 hypothetical protein HUO10_005132 [Paraburkholderia busanensis]
MKFDVATFTSLWLITFLCCALITTALSRMFARVAAFRFWAIGFYLLAASSACFALHLSWRTDWLLLATATLALQSRLLIWSGTRDLFGESTHWRTGLAISAMFCALYGGALLFRVPMLLRAVLLTLFFLPCRAATLYEVCRRQRPELGPARLIVVIGSVIAMLNAIVPVMLVLLDRTNLSLLLGNPQTTSALYAVVFAGDLLLACGLIALAFKLLVVERDMLATLDRGAIDRLAHARLARVEREALETARNEVLGHDGTTQRQTLPGAI